MLVPSNHTDITQGVTGFTYERYFTDWPRYKTNLIELYIEFVAWKGNGVMYRNLYEMRSNLRYKIRKEPQTYREKDTPTLIQKYW